MSPGGIVVKARRDRTTPVMTGWHQYDQPLTCAWPTCGREVDALPICWDHAVVAYGVVRSSMAAVLDHAAANATDQRRTEALPGFVYFIQFGDRITIGFSTKPDQRIAALPHDKVLAVFPGTRLNERQLHEAFKDLRITGEWFHLDDRLLDFIDDVEAQTRAG